MAARSAMACGLLVALTLSCAVPPERSSPPWCEPVAGMRCRLTAEEDEVSQGDEVVFLLHISFEGEPDGLILDRHLEPRRVRLTFTEVETGRTHDRLPEDGTLGMPCPRLPEDLVALSREPIEPGHLPVRLLTREGRQLPAGRYEVRAAYENDGPGGSWRGRLVSPPISFVVTPAAPREEEHEVPTRIALARDEHGLAFFHSAEATRRIRITVRPGFVVGTKLEYRIALGDGESGDGAYAVMDGVVRPSPGWRSWLPAEVAARAADEEVTITADVEVFETSIPGEHHWAPTRGDYRVLWRGRMEGSTMDRDSGSR